MEISIIIRKGTKALIKVYNHGEDTHSYLMPKNQLGSLLRIIEYELEKNGCNFIHRSEHSNYNQTEVTF